MLSILPLQRGNSELCQNAMPYDGPSLRSMRLGTLRARLPVCLCLPRALTSPRSRLSLSPSTAFSHPLSLSLSVIATFIFKVSWARYETGWIVFPLFPTFPYEQPWIPRMEMNVDYFIYRVVVVERIIVYC